MKVLWGICLLLLISVNVRAQITIDINSASGNKLPIAIVPVVPLDTAANPKFQSFATILERDLNMTGLFQLLSQKSFLENPNAGLSADQTNFSLWQKTGADALVKGGYKRSGDKYTLELRLFDIFQQQVVVGKRYTFTEDAFADAVHQFADQIIQKLTGDKGVFATTRLAFIGVANGKKEIFESRVDGSNLQQLTRFQTITLAPDWSRDGRWIGFTSYRAKNPDLYLLNRKSGESHVVSNKPGLNLGVAFSPSSDLLAVAVSNDSDSEIYVLNYKGQIVRQLTDNFWIDIEPTWSPDGKSLAFVSSQSGQPHIYRINADGTGLKRLTYQGYHNVSPAWSPRGNKIAFAGRDQGYFDIFIMDTDGSNIQRLTINSRNNETPAWSPNGQMIAFGSSRTGKEQIFIMGADGRGQTQITEGATGFSQPAWSPILGD